MPVICPAVLAETIDDYQVQIEKIALFAHRIQIDLTDGIFAAPKTITYKDAWWPAGVKADFHLMFKDPEEATKAVIKHRPHMIIAHAEADGEFLAFAEYCQKHSVKVGIALLSETSPKSFLPALEYIDHALIFSGHLGHYGGHANLKLLEKVKILKQYKPSLEIGWDGGVNDQNIAELVYGGVDVFNVGGYIQKAENPEKAFNALQRIADETGET
jgi:pentose-5-phosphate-3-epimerase